jgi:hypothetical protein
LKELTGSVYKFPLAPGGRRPGGWFCRSWFVDIVDRVDSRSTVRGRGGALAMCSVVCSQAGRGGEVEMSTGSIEFRLVRRLSTSSSCLVLAVFPPLWKIQDAGSPPSLPVILSVVSCRC